MKSPYIVVLALGSLFGGWQQAHASEVVMARDFYFHPLLYLQPQDSVKNDKEIDTKGDKAPIIDNIKDKAEIAKKQMTIFGPEGGYVLGFQVYFDGYNVPGPYESNSVRYECNSEGGILGGNIILPNREPQAVLNSPWVQLTKITFKTTVRQKFTLKPGLNLLKFELDPDKKFTEFADTGTPAKWTRASKEDNNAAVFAVNLVTKLQKPNLKIPPQKLPKRN